MVTILASTALENAAQALAYLSGWQHEYQVVFKNLLGKYVVLREYLSKHMNIKTQMAIK